MVRPKYSIVLPTLNGAETLAVTLPEMLKIDRDDVEWVISNNHSDDETKELVSSFSDSRVRLVEPHERLPYHKHLEFAYLQARGEWQGHMGDDDIIFPSRFDVLDIVIANSDVQVVWGRNVRYHWPDYLNANLANTIDSRQFDDSISEKVGKELATELLNTKAMGGAGTWIVHRSIIQKIRDRCGYFPSPEHGEFFAMRAACALSPIVIKIGLPILVLGRHAKSGGTQLLSPKGESNRSDWNWSFEHPNPWYYCPFQYKGHAAISFDGALSVRTMFRDVLGDAKIDWLYWTKTIYDDLGLLIKYKQLPPEACHIFNEGLKKLPWPVRLEWGLYKHRKIRLCANGIHFLLQPPKSSAGQTDSFGWSCALRGEKVGIHNIAEVPHWIERTYYGFFPQNSNQME